MARSVIRLEEKENEIFHANYYYMWKKLNTAPYYVNGFGEKPEWIRGELLLPSYVNLSKCMNPVFVPSVNIVNKIVQFYNANIKPEVDTYRFLHERLEESDSSNRTDAFSSVSPYCGMFYCYYFAALQDERKVFGALMRIREEGSHTLVRMITGLTTDEDLRNDELKKILEKDELPVEEYKQFRNSLPLSKRCTSLYKGGATVKPGLMSIQMDCTDREKNMLNLRYVISKPDDGFLGSLGILTFVNGAYDIRLLKMGIQSADNRELVPLSLKDPKLEELLSVRKTVNEHVHLAVSENTAWCEYIVRTAE